MKVKERGYELKVQCRMCRKTHSLMVGIEDYFMFEMPNRPYIQDIFPYLTPAERELLISGICGECWQKMFPPEPEEPVDFLDDEEKMADFVVLSKEEFLASYSYLTEEEYEATREAYEKSIKDTNRH